MRISNYINILIFFILFFLVIKFDSFSNISTKLETILPNSNNKELLKEFSKFKTSKKLFLAYKGLDKNSLKQLKILEKKLSSIKGLNLDTFSKSSSLREYENSFKLYNLRINEKKLNTLNVKKDLNKIRKNLINSDFSFILDKSDPFNLYLKDKKTKQILKNSHLFLKDYGYLSIFTINNSVNSLKEYERIYDSIYKIRNKRNHEIKLFSSIFYFVENQREIKSDVNAIILLSSIILIFLYLIILKNIKLLFNTLLTLSSSILFALLLSSFIFKELSIFVLVFGISISTVAVDYMFHHYMHKYYENKKSFNYNVFFGMITTVGAFFIISFISFDLLKQISYFAIFSLLFSYVQFSFLYPKIKFFKKEKNENKNKYYNFNLNFKPYIITLFSLFVILFTFKEVHFDLDIKNLDVQNTKLKNSENFFFTKLQKEKSTTVLIKAKSIEDLLNNAKDLKEKYITSYIPISVLLSKKQFQKKSEKINELNLNNLRSQIKKETTRLGFRDNFFKQAYEKQMTAPIYTVEEINSYGFELRKYKDLYISYALISTKNLNEVYKLPYINPLSIKIMFEETLFSLYKDLLFLGSITLIFIFLMLFLICKENYLLAINFILFPLSIILLSSLFIRFNILHIFMIFIILAISIDFGIYLSSKNLDINTKKAIFFSLLSTFSGFGVLIFSKINALFSIGLIASIGIIALMLLLVFQKKVFNDS